MGQVRGAAQAIFPAVQKFKVWVTCLHLISMRGENLLIRLPLALPYFHWEGDTRFRMDASRGGGGQ